MTKDEFWVHFRAAFWKNVTLRQELTRTTILDVQVEPLDWICVFSAEEVARQFAVTRKKVLGWIEQGRLTAKKVGEDYYVTREMLKEFLSHDLSRLDEVQWDEIDLNPRPEDLDRCTIMERVHWLGLLAEARVLKARCGSKEL